MGKQRWRRVTLRDLASRETQERVLGILDKAERPPEPKAPEKRPPETPQVEQFGRTLALTPRPGESV